MDMDKLKSLHKDFEQSLKASIEAKEKEEQISELRKSLSILKNIYSIINNELTKKSDSSAEPEKKENTENIKEDPLKDFTLITSAVVNHFYFYKNLKPIKYTVCISIIKLINSIYTIKYFDYISNNDSIIISFLVACLQIVDNIKGSLFYHLLVRKFQLYMNYIYQKRVTIKKNMSSLMKNYQIQKSETLQSFNQIFKKLNIAELCGSDSCKDKEEGIDLLVQMISMSNIFAEQFDIFYLSAPEILNNLLKDPSEDCNKAYVKFGNLLCTLLYVCRYQIFLCDKDIITVDAFDNNKNSNNTNKFNNNNFLDDYYDTDGSKIYYVYDNKIIENIQELDFLKGKKYQLTFQKDLLELNGKIVEICLLYIQTIIKYDKIFPLQFICYLILRRIYFTFPQYKKDITENIINVLSNLNKFQGQFEWNTSLECRQFSYYLLANDKELSSKIQSSTAVPPYDIKYENFILNKTNLTIGFNKVAEIKAGEFAESLIEVTDENSIVYISYGMEEGTNKSINVIFNKYDYNQKKWNNIFIDEEKEFSKGNDKIIIYTKECGIYKIVFDNSSSWIYKRKVIFRIVYLKPIDNDE